MEPTHNLEALDLYSKSPGLPPRPIIPVVVKPLKDLNIDDELAGVYAQAKAFLEEVQHDGSIPANQVAQVFNTISTILKEITKTQTELYNAERLKRVEAAIIQALKSAPKSVQSEFFEEYERILNELS